MSRERENERLRYQANYLGNLSIVVAGTGALAPIIGSAIGANPDASQNAGMVVLVLVSLACGAYMYVMGLSILNAITDD